VLVVVVVWVKVQVVLVVPAVEPDSYKLILQSHQKKV
jgi:hypothetical protein